MTRIETDHGHVDITYQPGYINAEQASYFEAAVRDAVNLGVAAGLAGASEIPSPHLTVLPNLDASVVAYMNEHIAQAALTAYRQGQRRRR